MTCIHNATSAWQFIQQMSALLWPQAGLSKTLKANKQAFTSFHAMYHMRSSKDLKSAKAKDYHLQTVQIMVKVS